MMLSLGFFGQALAFRCEFLVFACTGVHAEQNRSWNRAFPTHSGLAAWNP